MSVDKKNSYRISLGKDLLGASNLSANNSVLICTDEKRTILYLRTKSTVSSNDIILAERVIDHKARIPIPPKVYEFLGVCIEDISLHPLVKDHTLFIELRTKNTKA